MDLAAWWRARRWRALLELIEQLPEASRFREAVYNDPEQARLIALSREFYSPDEAEQEDREPWSPRLSEWNLQTLMLREIMHNTAAAAGSKKPVYFPMPRTEVDRQMEQLAIAQAVDIGARYGFSPEDFGIRDTREA